LQIFPTPRAFVAPFGVTPLEFHQEQESVGYCVTVVCVTLCLDVLIEHQIVTDIQTDRGP